MGKKRGGKRAEEFDDAASLSSAGTAFSSHMTPESEFVEALDPFAAALDDTYESRASTREKAWERLVALLRNSVRADDCANSASTLSSRCLSAMRKGGAAEAASAATALALHMLTLGEPDESAFQEMLPDLAKAAKQGKGAALRVAAVEALALCCFVAAEDELTTLEVMATLHALWGKDSPKLRAAALRGWCFLYTSLNSPLSSRQLEAQLSSLAGLLHDGDVDVRAAAGEGLALLYNTCGLGDSADDDESDEEEEEEADSEDEQPQPQAPQQGQQQPDLAPAGALPPLPPAPPRRQGDAMSLVSSSSVSGLDMVMDRVRELASNRGDKQRRSKRERVALKGAFRGLRSVLEDGHVPEQRIKLRHGDTLVISTMEGGVMMNYLKRFLAGGFQVHLQTNGLLHSVFGFTPLEGRAERLSAQEKRAYRSPCSAASKARSQARRSQRSFKGAAGGGDDW